MDISHLTDLLDQVVTRLDSIQNHQCKLDHAMERIDAVYNIIESQNQKLDEKLSDVHNDLLGRFHVLLDAVFPEHIKQDDHILDKLDKQQEHIIDKLDKQQEEIYDKLDKQQGKISDKLDKQISDMLIKHKQSCTDVQNKIDDLYQSMLNINTQADASGENIMTESNAAMTSNIDKVMDQVNTSITFLVGNMDTVEKNMAAVVTKIENVETSLSVRHKTVREDLLALKQGQDQLTTKVEQSTNDVKDDIYRSKREILTVTEKEAQIVRHRIDGPLTSLGKYTFDFYLNDFKTLIRSGKDIDSLPWHINEMKTCVKGLVSLEESGEMEVWLVYARHPREVGLRPVSGVKLTVKATISDIKNKVLQDVNIGEHTLIINEADINTNYDFGYKIGVTSCDDLIQKGYGDKEGYMYGALLIRYDVTVL